MSIRLNVYFASAGLLEIGLREAGIEPQQSFEIDPIRCATQRSNFSHEVVQCDMRAKLVAEEKPADVKFATFPCDRYSLAAELHGTRTGDDLFLHYFRHVAIDRPEVFGVENVPGMRKFPVVMEALTKLPGYYFHVVCPVQTSLWLPQQRPRLIILASRRPFAWRPPTSRRRVKLAEILEKDPQITIPPYVYKRLDGGYRDRPIISDPEANDVAPLCVAHYGRDRSTRLVRDRRFPRGVRPYTVREYARLQGVPDSFQFAGSEREAYEQIGDGVSVPVGRWIGKELRRYFGR